LTQESHGCITSNSILNFGKPITKINCPWKIADSYRDSLSGFFIGILYRDSLSGFFIGIDCTLMAQIELIFTDFFGIKF